MKTLLILAFALGSLGAFSEVSVQTGSGSDWGGIPSDAKALSPPERKVHFRSLGANINVQCLSANTRWAIPLRSSAKSILVGVPVFKESEKKLFAFELPAAFINGFGTCDEVNVYEVPVSGNDWLSALNSYTSGTKASIHDGGASCRMHGGSATLQFSSVFRNFKQYSSYVEMMKSGLGVTWGRNTRFNYLLRQVAADGSLSRVSSLDKNRVVGYYETTDGGGVFDINLALFSQRRTKNRRYGCGSFTSPLMVFFDDLRPRFTSLSAFPLGKKGDYVSWPEKDSAGYFLALDQNKDGKISEAYELFGNTGLKENYKNGFEALKTFDSNKDMRIDKKDKVFSRLVLWKDSNGNGIGESTEQHALSQKVKEISLDYKKSRVTFGKRAEELEKSTFVFINNKGKKEVGHISDIWFSSIPKSKLVSSNKKAIKKKSTESKAKVKKEGLKSKFKKWIKTSYLN